MITNLQLSMTATNVPTIGVYRPMTRRMAAVARRIDRTVMGVAGPLSRAIAELLIKANPTTSRIKMRPIPGQPPAKVEYKRRNWTHLSFTCSILNGFFTKESPTRRSDRASFEAWN